MDNHNEHNSYKHALLKVKKIKGFYAHLAVYIIVNAFIAIRTYLDEGIAGLKENSFNLLLFWGIGLAIHWFSVFGINFFLGKDWEKRKINEYMNDNRDKWE